MNLITVMGIIAAICTTVSFLPQAIKIIKTKTTKDISLTMYIILVIGVILWLIYGILTNDFPVILANGISTIFTLTILILKIKLG